MSIESEEFLEVLFAWANAPFKDRNYRYENIVSYVDSKIKDARREEMERAVKHVELIVYAIERGDDFTDVEYAKAYIEEVIADIRSLPEEE